MPENNFHIQGLTLAEVITARKKYGLNTFNLKKQNRFFDATQRLVKEPMVLLLLAASGIYFASGKTGDGIFLAVAITLVAGISLYQDSRSRNALEKLKNFSKPKCKVIRSGKILELLSEELVIGDALLMEEGTSIMGDGVIVQSNDFSVNESILTGESMAVYKDSLSADNLVFQGATVVSGSAVAQITAIGSHTRLGKIGESLESIAEEKTPLELQIKKFVNKMVIAGSIVLVIIWGINYFRSADILDSFLKALTLAMSILPEEIPVAFTTFMALGAWRMMKMGIVVKQMKTVETLGSASVICTDKTGTITENRMSLAKVYALQDNQTYDTTKNVSAEPALGLIRLAMWASEPMPFDPMEIALHNAYIKTSIYDERPEYKMIHEYPLGGRPPMMTHVFQNPNGRRITAAKGAPEALLNVSKLTGIEKKQVTEAIKGMAAEGYRVLGLGEAYFAGNNFPAKQQDFDFVFKGLVAFYDPPKQNIHRILDDLYNAGVSVKIITGDNAETTVAIARQIGFRNCKECLSGDELMLLPDKDLLETVKSKTIFTRMFPDAKLKIINALKSNHEIVAMIGDGVNDAPALKAAHIGIAMGKKGTEMAKEAASLVLLEDDLSKMVNAIATGRRIYTNLKKAIRYIISIHIPIILTVFIPLAWGWVYPNIFSPVHVIFLELIMGPTCSIVFENEPIEKNAMLQRPRPLSTTFFNWRELVTSIIQGLLITTGTLGVYQYASSINGSEQLTRSMVFICLIAANISLTLVNRSFYYSIFTTIRFKNDLVPLMLGTTFLLSFLLIYIRPFAIFFGFTILSPPKLLISTSIGILSVLWFELLKWRRRKAATISKIFI